MIVKSWCRIKKIGCFLRCSYALHYILSTGICQQHGIVQLITITIGGVGMGVGIVICKIFYYLKMRPGVTRLEWI